MLLKFVSAPVLKDGKNLGTKTVKIMISTADGIMILLFLMIIPIKKAIPRTTKRTVINRSPAKERMLDFMAESVGIAKNHSSTLKEGYLIFPGFGLLCEGGCHIIQHKKK